MTGAASAEEENWFRRAKFGVLLNEAQDPRIWVPRIAQSGAKYLVVPSPNAELTERARSQGLSVVSHPAYRIVGQLVPPGPLRNPNGQSLEWEAQFAMTEESGGATARELIRLLVEVVSKGGNLALALPPAPEGAVPILKEIGRWLKINGESIYGATESPFVQMPFFGRATVKGNLLYLHLFQWPVDRSLRVHGLRNRILDAAILGGTPRLRAFAHGVELPKADPGGAAVVVKLTLDGPPRVDPYLLQADESGVLRAGVESCEFETRAGQVVRKDNRDGRVYLSHWTRAIDVPRWKVRVIRAGRYAVETTYTAGPQSAGVVYTVTMKGLSLGMVKGLVEATGPVGQTVRVSDMQLDVGDYTLLVQPENKPGQSAMALEAVTLRRIGD